MQRRHLSLGVLATAVGWPWLVAAQPAPRIGVLLLHGKSPGSPQNPNIQQLGQRMASTGWLVATPEMPWSRNRYLQGDWDGVMTEMTDHVKTLRSRGATHTVVVGHSMGCPAALSFAARGGDAQALVLMAPGHVPVSYYNAPSLKAVRESIDEARALVAAGKGDETQRFNDINQGRQLPVVISARAYLSYFDPGSDAEMSVTAPRVPASTPVFTAIGRKDPMFPRVRAYYVDRLPPHPRSRLTEYAGGHLDTPQEVADDLLAWVPKALSA
ncbi:MAG: alpha/beta hydrolase [Hydrogenophaga sp.]|nr:alpha/beta hydrolase [Hydrogenophaga sp.]